MLNQIINNRFLIIFFVPFLLGVFSTLSFEPFNLTIINLTKRRKTEKYMLSFVIIISGIVLAIVSTKEFYDRVKLLENEDYENYELLTNTIYIYGFIIFIFFIILCYKFININEVHNIIKINNK